MKSSEKILKELFVGKTLTKLEYGEEGDHRSILFGKKIKNLTIGMEECREDGVIWLHLEDGEPVMVYGNEGIEVSE